MDLQVKEIVVRGKEERRALRFKDEQGRQLELPVLVQTLENGAQKIFSVWKDSRGRERLFSLGLCSDRWQVRDPIEILDHAEQQGWQVHQLVTRSSHDLLFYTLLPAEPQRFQLAGRLVIPAVKVVIGLKPGAGIHFTGGLWWQTGLEGRSGYLISSRMLGMRNYSTTHSGYRPERVVEFFCGLNEDTAQIFHRLRDIELLPEVMQFLFSRWSELINPERTHSVPPWLASIAAAVRAAPKPATQGWLEHLYDLQLLSEQQPVTVMDTLLALASPMQHSGAAFFILEKFDVLVRVLMAVLDIGCWVAGQEPVSAQLGVQLKL
jgi:hypothetical protein